jgi:hypothetical protein
LLILSADQCKAEPVWATGSSLLEVIGYDLQAQDPNQKLTDYQTNAVCLLLGYFRGFAESAALASHYNATALPFLLPDGITNEDIERAVYKYLSDNPDKLSLKGDALVIAALSKAYPNPSFKPPAESTGEQSPASPLQGADRLSKALMSGS